MRNNGRSFRVLRALELEELRCAVPWPLRLRWRFGSLATDLELRDSPKSICTLKNQGFKVIHHDVKVAPQSKRSFEKKQKQSDRYILLRRQPERIFYFANRPATWAIATL